MKSGKMMLVALALGGMVASGSAGAEYIPILPQPCTKVSRIYAWSNLEMVGTKIIYKENLGAILGWIAGYMTRVNYQGSKENKFNDLIEEVAWIVSWCRDNPSKGLSHAMEALTKARTGGR